MAGKEWRRWLTSKEGRRVVEFKGCAACQNGEADKEDFESGKASLCKVNNEDEEG